MSKYNSSEEFEITQENISQMGAKTEHKRRMSQDARDSNEESNGNPFYRNVNQQSEHIQQLVARIEELSDPAIRSLLAECMEAVLTLHSTGLERIFEIIEKTDGSAQNVKKNLLNDHFIEGMLVIHALHPDDLDKRLHRALDRVKPYMDSHGGSVKVISLDDGVAKLKLEGTCDGCPSSASTLKLGIEKAIEEECPDLQGLEVEGLADNPLAREIQKQNGPNNEDSNRNTDRAKWSVISLLRPLSNGDKQSVNADGVSLIICRVDGKLYAYHNKCAGCGMPMDSAKLKDGKLSCKLGHEFDVQKAGKNPDDPDIHLTPFPLLEENGNLKVAVG